ncbi:hypothetical protein HPB47_003298 [Ixodes persulcatus]|uniref:Uncharacterized protein n=1 Tax=Ixodes persulcatus TaxID=34615 RepID=A0AC60PIV7_IXOPE|nr:hypothetical protein HPB47_003298 [Ixodes persulcatus]
MNHAEFVSQKLSREHIQVTDSWLQACISHVRSENSTRSLSSDEMYRQVYHQLLFSDLNDMGTSCLPVSALTAHRLILKSSYFVQVDSIRDVSQPAYSQLLKLTGGENENTAVRAEPREAPAPWEAKTTRMLKLEVSDGTHRIQAFEFEVVASLTSSLPPGAKIIITGPLECRRGVVFLKSNSVRVLGGVVEALKAENSQKAVLSRAINRPVPDTQEVTRPNSNNNNREVRIGREVHSDRTATGSASLEGSASNRSPQRPAEASRWNPGSTASTVPMSSNRSTSNCSNRSTVPVDTSEAMDAADDSLLSQVNLEDLETLPDAEPLLEDAFEDDVDEDILREQLDFQANVDPSETVVPFTKLSLVLKDGKPPETPEVVVIKGYIATPTSKLRQSPEETWCLSVIVSDDTANLEVDIDERLLTKWLDITVPEVKRRKRLSSNFKQTFNDRVAQCQEKMSRLNELLSISFSGKTGELPVLTDYDDWDG